MNIKKHVGLGLFLLTGLTPSAFAQSSGFQVLGDISGTHSRFAAVEKSSTFGSSAGLNFKVNHPKFGNLAVTFSEQPRQNRNAFFRSGNQDFQDTASVLLLRGTGTLNGVSIPVAGSVYRENGVPSLHINFIAPTSSYNSYTTPVEVIQKLDGSSPSVDIPSANILDGKKCGAEKLPAITAPVTSSGSSSNSSNRGTALAAGTVKVIDIATEADFQYFSRYGSATNSHIASVINAAEVIYERDLGLKFNIVRQRVRSSSSQPYTSSNSETLLDQLVNEVSTSGGLQGADVVHLFTGKDLLDNVVGLAWLGVLCTTPSLSNGLTQAVSTSVDPVIFAHETGHNLGADHDSGLPRSLMYPMAGADQTFVSSRSKSEINSYFNVGGDDCFALESSSTPTPTPTAVPTGSGTASPTPAPTDGTGGGGGSGSGGGSTDPLIGFSATFNKTKGTLNITMSRRNITAGQCTAVVRIGSSSRLATAGGVEFDSEAEKLVFSSRTTKRLTSSRGKIFLQGQFTDCPNGEDITSAPIEIFPTFIKTTRRSDKVTAKNWINFAIQKMVVREQ